MPETIQLLRDAGVGVWMLTGDKYSTAVQIAVSCNLVSPVSGPILSGTDSPSLEDQYGILPIEGDDSVTVFASLKRHYHAWEAGLFAL